jgi:hypothetical protein
MGAYGDVLCSYCNEYYYELDEHVCDTNTLKDRIRTQHLQAQVRQVRRRVLVRA